MFFLFSSPETLPPPSHINAYIFLFFLCLKITFFIRGAGSWLKCQSPIPGHEWEGVAQHRPFSNSFESCIAPQKGAK